MNGRQYTGVYKSRLDGILYTANELLHKIIDGIRIIWLEITNEIWAFNISLVIKYKKFLIPKKNDQV